MCDFDNGPREAVRPVMLHAHVRIDPGEGDVQDVRELCQGKGLRTGLLLQVNLRHRILHYRRPSAGVMFWFTRNRFPGS